MRFYEFMLRSLMLLLSSWISFFFSFTTVLRLACVHYDNYRGISYLPPEQKPNKEKKNCYHLHYLY
uniref:Putative ovule protein n=1 Tax=Solanum chacoense TaxID=4108 RepID=A0A0V0I859_SOLCH